MKKFIVGIPIFFFVVGVINATTTTGLTQVFNIVCAVIALLVAVFLVAKIDKN